MGIKWNVLLSRVVMGAGGGAGEEEGVEALSGEEEEVVEDSMARSKCH